jgi:flavin-dependent dehydrogenase
MPTNWPHIYHAQWAGDAARQHEGAVMIARMQYDVLVVGARCAGAATAMLLARAGVRVMLVDRADYGSDTLSTHALMRGGVLQLHRWGVLPQVVSAHTPAIRRTSFHYGEAVVDLPVKPSPGVEALYAPRRTVLDRILVDAARNAGAEVRHGLALAGLHGERGRGHRARFAGSDGEITEIGADLVIGADGAASTVARLMSAPIVHQAHHAGAVVYGHWSGLTSSGYTWLYRPDLAAGIIPTNHGHCVFVAVPPARYRQTVRPDPACAYHKLLEAITPEIADALRDCRQDGALSVFPGRAGFMRQAAGSGWALVGDAGYFKDPLTAHGMTDALRDAELLARAVVRGGPQHLSEYQAVRDALSMPLMEATEAIASFDWDLERLPGLHRTLNHAMKCEVDYLAALGCESSTACFPALELIS